MIQAIRVGRARFELRVALALALSVVLAPAQALADEMQSRRSFTVTDVIELQRVVAPVGGDGIVYSPDNRHAAFVISRGNAKSGALEYSLHVVGRDGDGLASRDGRTMLGEPIYRTAMLPTDPDGMRRRRQQPGIDQLQWAPDGKHLMFLSGDNEDRLQIVRLRIADGRSTTLTPGNENVVSFATSSNSVVYTAIDERATALNGQRLTHGMVITNTYLPDLISGFRSRLGNMSGVVYRTEARSIDGPASEPSRTFEHGLANVDAETLKLWLSPNGKLAVGVRTTLATPADWPRYQRAMLNPLSRYMKFVLFDTQSEGAREMLGSPTGLFSHAAPVEALWRPDSNSVILTNTYLPFGSRDVSEHEISAGSYVVEYFPTSSTFRVVTVLPKDLDGVWVEKIGLEAGGDAVSVRSRTTRGGRATRWFARSEAGWEELPAKRAEDGVDWLSLKESRTQRPFLRLRQGSRRWRSVDLNPQLDAIALTDAQDISWKDHAGTQWQGTLLYPDRYSRDTRYPLVIQTHGYNPQEFLVDGPYGYATGYAARPLAAQGFAVLQMQDRDELIANRDEGRLYADAYLAAIDTLAKRGLVDPSRVGIIGYSRTAYHVKYALTHNPAAFRAAAIADGSDHSYLQYMMWFTGERAGNGELSELLNGDTPPYGIGLSKWRQNAPGFMLDRVRTPVRILIPYATSLLSEWEWYVGLKRLGVPVEAAYTSAGSHLIEYPAHRLLFQEGNVDWFRFWLKDAEDSDSAKSEQYRRWRELRAAFRR